ncbi:MAG TPA: ABC transporter substrate-binding protein [Steroidobacteraceae bacterium]|nr:ABC transporter substrate-binding protein [Steroidobacteraceae bacterium]
MRHATVVSGMCLALGLTVGAPYAAAQSEPAAQAPAAAAAAAPLAEGPAQVVENAANGMLGDLDKDRDTYRRDPAKVGQLVDKYLLPHFDNEYSARLVLGQHWRNATPEQRQRFIDAFYHSLLNNYGSAIVDFTADRLKIFPTRDIDPEAKNATVRTEVRRSNGDRVSVNYYLRRTPQGWKVWDVVIDGISYVNSYREDFGAQIQQQGIDAVIKRLEAGEKPESIGRQTGGKSG